MPIRRARPDEADALTQLASRAKAVWGYPAAALDAWRDALTVTPHKIESRPVWVFEASAGGPVLGFHALRELAPADWELDDLWVDPAHQRRGVGSALMRHAVALARALGAHSLSIDADPNAEPFYAACGAVRIGAVPAPIAGDPARVRPQMRIDVAERTAAGAGG
jgi:ribosomal protein S18 acetylase RimI-like enzyme